MKRLILTTIVAAAASVGVASTAGAAPTKNVEVWTCDGVETEITVAGRSGWIDGVHYLAHNLVVDGVFTPVEGEPEAFHDEQWMSGRTGGLDCTTTFTDTNEEGTAEVTITLNAIATG